jgi:DUF2905 family protein
MEDTGKLLIIFGIVIVVLGIGFVFFNRVPWLAKLPGDITIQRDNFSCSFPLVTSILLSIILTIVLNLVLRIVNR